MSPWTVYLAGPITGLSFEHATEWRQWVADNAPAHWTVLDPLRGCGHLKGVPHLPPDFNGEFEAFNQDLADIRAADVVLINLQGAVYPSIGTMCELGYAFALGKFIVTVDQPERSPHNHLFVRAMTSGWIAPSLSDAIEAIRERELDVQELAA